MKIVLIYGYPGSGKSSVLKILKERGFYTYDCDEIVKNLYLPSKEGSSLIKKKLGVEYLNEDNSVNKKKLREFVFRNESNLGTVNSLIHPLVLKKIREISEKNEGEIIFIETIYPQIFNFANTFNVLVERSRRAAIEASKQKLINEENYHFIIKNLGNLPEADCKISNNRDINLLERQVDELLLKLKKS